MYDSLLGLPHPVHACILGILLCVGTFDYSLACPWVCCHCVCTLERTSPACGVNSVPKHVADSTC